MTRSRAAPACSVSRRARRFSVDDADVGVETVLAVACGGAPEQRQRRLGLAVSDCEPSGVHQRPWLLRIIGVLIGPAFARGGGRLSPLGAEEGSVSGCWSIGDNEFGHRETPPHRHTFRWRQNTHALSYRPLVAALSGPYSC